MEKNKIFNEDCSVTMNNMINDNFNVDLILTSPPYNISQIHNKYSVGAFNGKQVKYDEYKDNLPNDKYIEWMLSIFNQYDKILKKDGVVLFNFNYGSTNTELIWKLVNEIITNTNFTVGDCIIWKKRSALPNNANPNKLTRIIEFVFVFCRKQEFLTYCTNKKITSQTNGTPKYSCYFNFIDTSNNAVEKNELNNATFPVEFVTSLLDIYGKKDYVVYDSFMGTGTTAVACKQFGCYYIGSELSKQQVDYANDRISGVNRTLSDNKRLF